MNAHDQEKLRRWSAGCTIGASITAPEYEILDGDPEALRVFEHFMDTGKAASLPATSRPCGVAYAPGSTSRAPLATPSLATLRAVILALREQLAAAKEA